MIKSSVFKARKPGGYPVGWCCVPALPAEPCTRPACEREAVHHHQDGAQCPAHLPAETAGSEDDDIADAGVQIDAPADNEGGLEDVASAGVMATRRAFSTRRTNATHVTPSPYSPSRDRRKPPWTPRRDRGRRPRHTFRGGVQSWTDGRTNHTVRIPLGARIGRRTTSWVWVPLCGTTYHGRAGTPSQWDMGSARWCQVVTRYRTCRDRPQGRRTAGVR